MAKKRRKHKNIKRVEKEYNLEIESIKLSKLKIKDKKLKRYGAMAQCYKDGEENIIEIDFNQHKGNEKELQNSYVHEFLHCILPDIKELEIKKIADSLAAALWKMGYRRINL